MTPNQEDEMDKDEKYITTSFRHDVWTSEQMMDIITYLENKTGIEVNSSDAIRWAIKQAVANIKKELAKE
jgi:acyl carrier protein